MNIVCVVFDTLRRDFLIGQPEWGQVHTPNLDAFAAQSVVYDRAYPEVLPTLPARRALYTGKRVYPFHNSDFRLKGDFVGAPGWGPIPEEQDTVSELMQRAGYRTALVSDVHHQFKPSKNYWRGFDEWVNIRGQEADRWFSGPYPTDAQIDALLHPSTPRAKGLRRMVAQCIMNSSERRHEEDFQAPRVLADASRWLERNRDAEQFFLQVESFDPHEPWMPPPHYREMYTSVAPMPRRTPESPDWIVSCYDDVSHLDPAMVALARANFSAAATLCDRWFGHFMESMRVTGRLDDTAVVVLSDHGHSMGERGYFGKRPYPSEPEVFDTALMVRYAGGASGGTRSDEIVQHHDVAASILDAAGIEADVDGRSFWNGKSPGRSHATIGWGPAPTVVKDNWWFNGKLDGTGFLLFDRSDFSRNVAAEHPGVARELFELAMQDAGPEGPPSWLVDNAKQIADAPGCSDVAPPRVG